MEAPSEGMPASASLHIEQSQGLSPLSKGDFFKLFWPTWVDTFEKILVKMALTATGIPPVNSDIKLNTIGISRHTTPGSLVSISSASTAYTAEDLLKACSRLRTEVKDPRSVGARKLGQTIHLLSTQIELLHGELDGLRKKLYQNRKRQKVFRKQMDLQQHQKYHSGAMMWSPRPI